jgi:glycosyltransferase involved in cell wall biosynthesis
MSTGTPRVCSRSASAPALAPDVPGLRYGPMALRTKPRAALVHARAGARRVTARVRTELDLHASRSDRADVAIFHEHAPAPSGGGNQFVLALQEELRRRGLAVEQNRISGGTPCCLFNSFNFDLARLRRFARDDVRLVHRVDGPIGTYRGYDDGTDARIARMNAELADSTVCQSRFSLDAHRRLGIALADPVVIPNAPDPEIFRASVSREPLDGRAVRVVAVSWSDNPRKGADVLRSLGASVDPTRYELTFVGRAAEPVPGWTTVAPLASQELAELLRGMDCYVAASIDDPCSNALLEALACGLPALYRRSGGHPELVGEGGVGFDGPDDAAPALGRLAAELDERRAAIVVPALADVADAYLEVLGR